jgi:hypothetical protein
MMEKAQHYDEIIQEQYTPYFEGNFMTRVLFLISLVLLIGVSIGCIDITIDDFALPALGSQFKLKVGQTTALKSDNIKVTLLKVTEDSRCASDVVCIWAGQVNVLVNVTKNGKNLGDVTLTLGAGNPDLAVKNVGDYSIKVIEVNPYPISTHKIESSEYIVTLKVSRI